MMGISSAGTIKDPTTYQISIAYSKTMANKMEKSAVMTNPHRVYLNMIESFWLACRRNDKSLPIVYADIKEKLSTVDMTMAKRETIKSPFASGGSTFWERSK